MDCSFRFVTSQTGRCRHVLLPSTCQTIWLLSPPKQTLNEPPPAPFYFSLCINYEMYAVLSCLPHTDPHSLPFHPLTSQPNQEFCWQWNILNLTTPRKTFWRIAFYFGWPNCTLPMAAPCAVSHSLLKRLHFYIQIIHHRLDLFPPFFTFRTFGVLCGDLRWGGRKRVLLCFFFPCFFSHSLASYCWNTLSLWCAAENRSDRQGCPIYSQIKKNHTGRRC